MERQQDIRLMDRSDDEIASVVAEWLASPDDNLISLQERLLLDQPWCDGDTSADQGGDALAKAVGIIEDTIDRMEPTPINLRRIRGWCQNYTLGAGYEALLTRFAGLMTENELREYHRAASSAFQAEIVEAWQGIKPAAN